MAWKHERILVFGIIFTGLLAMLGNHGQFSLATIHASSAVSRGNSEGNSKLDAPLGCQRGFEKLLPGCNSNDNSDDQVDDDQGNDAEISNQCPEGSDNLTPRCTSQNSNDNSDDQADDDQGNDAESGNQCPDDTELPYPACLIDGPAVPTPSCQQDPACDWNQGVPKYDRSHGSDIQLTLPRN